MLILSDFATQKKRETELQYYNDHKNTSDMRSINKMTQW
jgi:hypothetical protein